MEKENFSQIADNNIYAVIARTLRRRARGVLIADT